MKNLEERNPLLIPRVVFTLSIFTLSIISYYLITASTSAFLQSSSLTKLIGKQRMLSQQIINSIAADNLEGKLEGPPLLPTITNFISSQHVLTEQKWILNNHTAKDSATTELYNLNLAFQRLLTSISKNISSDEKNDFLDLLNTENVYLQQLDDIAENLNGYSNQQVQKLKLKEITILISCLLLLFLEIIWLVIPAMKKANKQNEVLVEMTTELKESYKSLQLYVEEIESKNESLKKIADMQAHEIRHPLTSIIGLVNLIQQADYVVDKEWLSMMCEAANTLDEKIKAIISESTASKNLKVIQFNKVVDEIEDYAILLLDKNGNIENWNRGAEKLKGYKANEIIGRHFSIFYTDDDKKRNRPGYLLEQAKNYGFAKDEGWRVRKDNSRFWGSILITAIHDDNHEVIGFTKVTRDQKENSPAHLHVTYKTG